MQSQNAFIQKDDHDQIIKYFGNKNIFKNRILVLDGESDKKMLNLVLDNLSSFENLQNLHLSNCDLNSVPPTVFHCANLKTLNLDNNKITSISDNISNLQNLEFLDISSNLLTSLPSGITKLTKLESFYIDNTKFNLYHQKFLNFVDVSKILHSLKLLSTNVSRNYNLRKVKKKQYIYIQIIKN
jgi:Leucine-rich repeat (LRR) protein